MMNAKSIKCGALLICLLGGISTARAIPYIVDALANSSSGGSGAATITLAAGEWFSISVSPSDLWNAGPLPRWSNADGLIVKLYATGTDESGQAAGTLIGDIFPLYTQSGLTAPYGALVGKIDGGAYFLVGTSFSGPAPNAGELKLFYWDSNNYDNSEHVTIEANVTKVPDGGLSITLLGIALSGLAALRRRI
jgi:hypothetical protein